MLPLRPTRTDPTKNPRALSPRVSRPQSRMLGGRLPLPPPSQEAQQRATACEEWECGRQWGCPGRRRIISTIDTCSFSRPASRNSQDNSTRSPSGAIHWPTPSMRRKKGNGVLDAVFIARSCVVGGALVERRHFAARPYPARFPRTSFLSPSVAVGAGDTQRYKPGRLPCRAHGTAGQPRR